MEKHSAVPRPPVSATQVHLHPHDQEVAPEIPSRACRHSAVEIRPRAGAAASAQHGAVTSVLSARRVTRSHKALRTT